MLALPARGHGAAWISWEWWMSASHVHMHCTRACIPPACTALVEHNKLHNLYVPVGQAPSGGLRWRGLGGGCRAGSLGTLRADQASTKHNSEADTHFNYLAPQPASHHANMHALTWGSDSEAVSLFCFNCVATWQQLSTQAHTHGAHARYRVRRPSPFAPPPSPSSSVAARLLTETQRFRHHSLRRS